ncbi:MAG: hypothetical protein IKD71_08030 [Solobacterium sp.]|nr:hypothetical protein [Solobacterium sp.]
MNLEQYDDLCVRIVLIGGEYFEGACQYFGREYNEAELGIDSESLNIAGWMFRPEDIEEIIVIDEEHPYLEPYGRPEKEAVADTLKDHDPWWIDDLLFTEEPRNIVRMLACLDDCLAGDFPFRNEVLAMIERLIPYVEKVMTPDENKEVIEASRRILETYKKEG